MHGDTVQDGKDGAPRSGVWPKAKRFAYWLRGEPFNKTRAIRWTVLPLLACWVLALSSRYARSFGLLPDAVNSLLGLLNLVLLWGTTLYVLVVVRSLRVVRATILVGVFFLVLVQLAHILALLPVPSTQFLLSQVMSGNMLYGETLAITGGILLLAGLYVALLENENTVRYLDIERGRLSKTVAERLQAEAALQQAHSVLEQTVERRTAELAQRNAQLQRELAERRRAERQLGLRLRYEEGLAACSQTLLTGTKGQDVLVSALKQLLHTSEASRVTIFENRDDAKLGTCMCLTHEIWDAEQRPTDASPLPSREPYAGRFERWQEELGQGRIIAGPIEAFPAPERDELRRFGLKSVLLLPLVWSGAWRGFLGFDDRAIARDWSFEEVRLLRTAAEMIGAFKERQRGEQALHEAYEDLDQRVQERTADLMKSNERIEQEIVERQHAEQEMRRLVSQLQEARKMQAVGALAGGIAHDFNNILASILGYAELGLRKIDAESPFRRHFEEVRKAGERAKELVRQILLFSRQVEQEQTPVHLHLIVKEVAELLRASCGEDIEIRTRIDSNSGAVLGDAVQLHQVIMNLCVNAQHAMQATGGVLDLSVEGVHLDAVLQTAHARLEPGMYVRVTVGDTGGGMSRQTLERVFEPFFTTKTVGEGTGMGLAIAHGIVTGLHGGITVDSAFQRGSTFAVYLPRYQAEEQPELRGVVDALRGTERILVVDDEPQLLSMWTEMLGLFGYRVTPHSSSLEALEYFHADPDQFDLVLLDQTMPGLTGSELAQQMLAKRPELPIILATGFSESITPAQAREIGIRDFVLKPILGNDLSQAIRKALDEDTASTRA